MRSRNKTFPLGGDDMSERPKLIKLRGQKSRQKVAKDLGITPQMLGAIERGSRNPSLALAKKMASYYGVSVDEVAEEVESGIYFNQKGNETFPKNKSASSA
jgi:putative transcriptional regulator